MNLLARVSNASKSNHASAMEQFRKAHADRMAAKQRRALVGVGVVSAAVGAGVVAGLGLYNKSRNDPKDAESGGAGMVNANHSEASIEEMQETFDHWLNYSLTSGDNEVGVAVEVYSGVMEEMFRRFMSISDTNREKIVAKVYDTQYQIFVSKEFELKQGFLGWKKSVLHVNVDNASDSIANLINVPSRVYALAYGQWFDDSLNDAGVKTRAEEVFRRVCIEDDSKYLTIVLCGFLWMVITRVYLPWTFERYEAHVQLLINFSDYDLVQYFKAAAREAFFQSISRILEINRRKMGNPSDEKKPVRNAATNKKETKSLSHLVRIVEYIQNDVNFGVHFNDRRAVGEMAV